MINHKSFRPEKLTTSATIHQWLLASSCFGCFLLLCRMLATQSLGYIFLPWNLFLAFVPYWITGWINRTNTDITRNKIKLILTLTAWLVFIPNSFYIITDLFHFTHIRSAPKWFDLLLIFSFAWNGILFGIISLRRVEIIITKLKGKNVSLIVVVAVLCLCAYGIYIGRYLRFNSWDVIVNPFSLFSEIANMFIYPFQNLFPWRMILCYAVFMALIYFTIKKMGELFTSSK